MFLIARSYANSYSHESPENSISSLVQSGNPVITFSRRIAFHINHYYSNECYQVVADKEYASHMKTFSKDLIQYPLQH